MFASMKTKFAAMIGADLNVDTDTSKKYSKDLNIFSRINDNSNQCDYSTKKQSSSTNKRRNNVSLNQSFSCNENTIPLESEAVFATNSEIVHENEMIKTSVESTKSINNYRTRQDINLFTAETVTSEQSNPNNEENNDSESQLSVIDCDCDECFVDKNRVECRKQMVEDDSSIDDAPNNFEHKRKRTNSNDDVHSRVNTKSENEDIELKLNDSDQYQLPNVEPNINTMDDESETSTTTFNCPFNGCSRTYTQMYNMKRHMRSHLGLKPYICRWPNCDFSSERGCVTIAHIRKRHFNIGSGGSFQSSSVGTSIMDPRNAKLYMEVKLIPICDTSREIAPNKRDINTDYDEGQSIFWEPNENVVQVNDRNVKKEQQEIKLRSVDENANLLSLSDINKYAIFGLLFISMVIFFVLLIVGALPEPTSESNNIKTEHKTGCSSSLE
ncbi:Krueppel-like factor 15 [Blomia tropicalis]|nr:Krueppel-like factor 15 [Blomia tropicalis]